MSRLNIVPQIASAPQAQRMIALLAVLATAFAVAMTPASSSGQNEGSGGGGATA